MLESKYQSILIRKLKKRYPKAVIMKNDATYIQGIPDLTILYHDRWAMLECKQSLDAKRRPNQVYYVNKMDNMSFARFICPENEEEVLNDLDRSLKRYSRRRPRIPEPEQG